MASPLIHRYVAIGDSLTEGYSDYRAEVAIGFAFVLAGILRDETPGLDYTNLGVGGARTADVLRSQVQAAIALRPDLLTLVVGANDIPGTPAEEFRRDYAALVEQLRQGVPGLLLVANIPDFAHLLPVQYTSYRIALQQRVEAFNRYIAEVAEQHSTLLVDIHSSREADDPRNLSGDGVHPNARGYRIMAHAFVETLNRAALISYHRQLIFPSAELSRLLRA